MSYGGNWEIEFVHSPSEVQGVAAGVAYCEEPDDEDVVGVDATQLKVGRDEVVILAVAMAEISSLSLASSLARCQRVRDLSYNNHQPSAGEDIILLPFCCWFQSMVLLSLLKDRRSSRYFIFLSFFLFFDANECFLYSIEGHFTQDGRK